MAKSKSNAIEFIHQHYDCISYCRNELNRPVYKDGDRTYSLAPGSHNKTAMVVYKDSWHDFKTGYGGDVIALCAYAKYNGNMGEAIRELAGDFCPETRQAQQAYVRIKREMNEYVETCHKHLRADDIEYLHSRKILDKTIERLKIGFDNQKLRLVFPFFKNGQPVYFTGRDTTGHWKEDKKYPKYKHETCDNLGLKCKEIWGLHSLIRTSSQGYLFSDREQGFNYNDWLIIAEGAFDALSFEQEGFHVICSMGTEFSDFQLKEVVNIAKGFEHVLICYDNDGPGSDAQKKLAKTLFSHRIDFACANIPKSFNGHDVKDVSDFYCAGGNLGDLVDNSTKGLDFLATILRDMDSFKKFAQKAARYIDKVDFIELCMKLKDWDEDKKQYVDRFPKHWLKALMDQCLRCPAETVIVEEFCKANNIKYVENDSFYEYGGGIWYKVADNYIKYLSAQLLGRFASYGKMNNITGYLKAKLSTSDEFNTRHIFNFSNGVLNLDSGEFSPHSDSFMSTIQARYCFDRNAKASKWIKFISEIMENDEKKMNLLQEIAGYVLFPDNRLHKCFFLVGEGSNGKSVFIDILRSVFGKDNCSNVDVSEFGGPFDPIRLRSSLVNFCAEAKTNLKEAESRFKAIVSGDVISAAYKGKDAIEFAPRCKIISAANDFIGSSDMSHGFTRRLIFVMFNRIFDEKDANKNLTQELITEELPGIFNWVYQGYLRLIKKMEFTETAEQSTAQNEFLKNASPVAAFAEDELVGREDEIRSLTHRELFEKYSKWCKDFGYKLSNKYNFTRNFKKIAAKLFPGIIEKYIHGVRYFKFLTTADKNAEAAKNEQAERENVQVKIENIPADGKANSSQQNNNYPENSQGNNDNGLDALIEEFKKNHPDEDVNQILNS